MLRVLAGLGGRGLDAHELAKHLLLHGVEGAACQRIGTLGIGCGGGQGVAEVLHQFPFRVDDTAGVEVVGVSPQQHCSGVGLEAGERVLGGVARIGVAG